jgi:chromosome segregation ATPase
MLKLVPDWVIYAAAAALVSLLGLQTVRLAWVQAEYASYQADVAENTRKAEVQARAKEKTMRDSADRIANEQAAKESELAAAAARADATAASLRDEIDRLNASPAPTNPAAAALAREAATARKLLGACAERYRGLAKGALELKDQVIGLQGFANAVCHAPD